MRRDDVAAAVEVVQAAVAAAADYSQWQVDQWLEDYTPSMWAMALEEADAAPSQRVMLALVLKSKQLLLGDEPPGAAARGRRLHGGSCAGSCRDDEVVGVVQVRHQSSTTAAISGLFVHPSHGRRGYGSALLTAAERVATSWGATRVVLRSTIIAEALYRRRGYVSDPATKPTPAELGVEFPLQRWLVGDPEPEGEDRG